MHSVTKETAIPERDPNQEFLVWEQCLLAVFVTCTIILTVISNIVNMAIIKNDAQIKSVTRIFLMSLTVADLCIGAICEPFGLASVIAKGWPVCDLMCTVIGCLVNTLCAMSITSLLLISIDRYIAITRPLRYHKILTSRRAKQMTVVCWLFCLFYMIGCSAVWGPYVDYQEAAFGCTINWNAYYDKTPILISCLIFVVCPSTIIFIMYTRLFWIAYRHSIRMARVGIHDEPANGEHAFRKNLISLKDSKALRTFVYVWMAFNFAWIPYVVYNFYMIIDEEHTAPILEFSSTWLALSNSWWNVIIYSVTNSSFRHTAAGIFCRCRHRLPNNARYTFRRGHRTSSAPPSSIQHVSDNVIL